MYVRVRRAALAGNALTACRHWHTNTKSKLYCWTCGWTPKQFSIHLSNGHDDQIKIQQRKATRCVNTRLFTGIYCPHNRSFTAKSSHGIFGGRARARQARGWSVSSAFRVSPSLLLPTGSAWAPPARTPAKCSAPRPLCSARSSVPASRPRTSSPLPSAWRFWRPRFLGTTRAVSCGCPAG